MKSLVQYHLFCLGLLLLLAPRVQAQKPLGYPEVERRSKYLFLDEQYAELVAYGDTALAAGQDYFALRYRLGAACFKLRKYGPAARHFSQAHAMNSGEVETIEYLYYSLLYSGQGQAAQLLIKDFPASLRSKLELKPSDAFVGLNLEGGAKLSSDTNAVGNMQYLSLNLSHQFTPRLQLLHGFSILSQELKFGQYKQFQYYAAPRYYLGKGFSVNGTWHYMHMNGSRTFYPWFMDPLPPLPMGGWRSGTFSSSGNLVNLGLSWQRAYVQVRAFGNATFFHNFEELGPPRTDADSSSNFTTTQAGVGLDLNPPIFKQHLFLSTTAMVHNLNGASTFLLSQSVGYAITPHIYLEGRYMKGGTAYFNELDGTLLNNTADPMKHRFAALLNVGISKKLGLYGMYQHEIKHSSSNSSDYHYSNIITGINIKL